MLLDVIDVQAQQDFILNLKFENGECRRFNMAPYIDQKPWVRLKLAGVGWVAGCLATQHHH